MNNIKDVKINKKGTIKYLGFFLLKDEKEECFSQNVWRYYFEVKPFRTAKATNPFSDVAFVLSRSFFKRASIAF